MTKIKKAVQIRLLNYAKKLLDESGFTFEPQNWHPYSIETKSGRLGVTPRVDHFGVDFFAVYDDVSKAIKNKITCNPYSGKYNHLCLTEESQIKYIVDLYVNN